VAAGPCTNLVFGIAVDLTRPVDLQTWRLAEDLGRAAYTALPRLVPSVLVGDLMVGLTHARDGLAVCARRGQHRPGAD
jgi:hypothetical protein